MNAYQRGIAARKLNIGQHENPFIGQSVCFFDWLFNPRIHVNGDSPADKKNQWDEGWVAEDEFQKEKTK